MTYLYTILAPLALVLFSGTTIKRVPAQQVFPRSGIGFPLREYEVTCFNGETYSNNEIIYNRFNKDVNVMLLDKNNKPQQDYILDCANDPFNESLLCTVKPQRECLVSDSAIEYRLVATLYGEEYMSVLVYIATLKKLTSYSFDKNERYGILQVTKGGKTLFGMKDIPISLETGSAEANATEATIQYIKPNFEGLDGCFMITDIENNRMTVKYKDTRICQDFDFSELNQVKLQLSIMLSSREFNYLFDMIMLTIEVDYSNSYLPALK